MSCYRIDRDGIVLTVRVTARAGRDGVDGIKRLADGREAAAVRVRAVPEKGAANDALVAALAAALGRPRSAISVIAGASARLKQVKISGDGAALAAIVESWQRRQASPQRP